MPDKEENERKFPYEITLLEKENPRIVKDFKGFVGGAVRVGPEGYFFLRNYENVYDKIYNFEVKATDVYVATFPRCGTTWTQEMVWMIRNNFDLEAAKENIDFRFPFLEAESTMDPRAYELPFVKDHLKTDKTPKPGDRLQRAVNAKSPRCLKLHCPFSLLPPDLLEKSKVIYVMRDPRDVLVSLYHHHFMIRSFGFDGSFETFFEYFINDEVIFGPFWSNIREAWQLRDHPNLLIFKFEDIKKDTKVIIRKVATFLGKSITDDQVEMLARHLSLEEMKKNTSTNGEGDYQMGFFKDSSEGFIRSGKVGGWRDVLTDEMKERLKIWSSEKSGGLDKTFGYY